MSEALNFPAKMVLKDFIGIDVKLNPKIQKFLDQFSSKIKFGASDHPDILMLWHRKI